MGALVGESLFRDQRGDFGTDAAQAVGFMDDDQPPGSGDRGEDGGLVERLEAAQVDDFGGDALARPGLRRLQAAMGTVLP